MKTFAFFTLPLTALAFRPTSLQSKIIKKSSLAMSSPVESGLVDLARKQNPVVGYFDPLSLAEQNFWGQTTDATIGFLRQAEIKHGRVAMAAFVGYWVQSNWHFPCAQTLSGDPFPSIDLSPEQQWDACPLTARIQILSVIGLLEIWDEYGGGDDNAHYMRGRQPGKYPTFAQFRDNVHFVFDLYDPFNFNKKMSEEKKAERLVMEVNNGRLAMIGIFSFLVADKIPGAVPALADIATPYDGNVMIPFGADFSLSQETIVGTLAFVGILSAANAANSGEEYEAVVEVKDIQLASAPIIDTNVPPTSIPADLPSGVPLKTEAAVEVKDSQPASAPTPDTNVPSTSFPSGLPSGVPLRKDPKI